MKLNEISENISHTSKRLRDIERKKGVKPGTPEWFKLWFSLPYLKESTLHEGYKIQLERGKDMDVLHIVDTKTNKRTEVRGKPGYETAYDPECPLHQLIDKIGKAANISELINGEVVTINPKHPDSERATSATATAFNEDAEVDLHGNAERGYVLSKISVPADQRGQGRGTEIMQQIVDRMDKEGAIIALTPDTVFGGAKGKLIDFYKRFGFVPNKGRNKDFRFRETMIRYPKQINEENIYDILEPEDCGPFDGGCVLVAQALQQMHGGDIVVLVNDKGIADHAAVKVGNTLIDYDGPLPVDKFIKRFEKNELANIESIRPMKSNDLPNATRNQSLLPKIVNLLSKKKKYSKVNEETGAEMLSMFQNMHHDTAMNKEMDQFILTHDWELRDFTPDMFPSEEEFFDYDDPFDRVIDIDYSHRVNLSQPIIVGPQYSDGKYSVIDGNHRAARAQSMGKTIKGYFPVKKVSEAFDTDVEWVLDRDARNQQIFATKIDDAYIKLFYKRIFPADVYVEFTRGGQLRVTGEGLQNKIFGAVINHVKQWVAKNNPPRIIFSAHKGDASRSGLYSKMVQRFASQNGYDYNVEDTGDEDTFILTKKQQPTQTNEALDQPYPFRWSAQNKNLWYAHANEEEEVYDQIDISIALLSDGVWDINFRVDEAVSTTGKGDQFRIFATVKAVVQEWWKWASKNADVKKITFSADKAAGKSRSKLYQRFAQQFANAIGYEVNVKSGTNSDIFSIEKSNVEENVTDNNVSSKSNAGLGLTIFDIDETLMRTTAQIKVVKDGKTVRSLTNQEFNNHKLQPGEEFDFGEFRNAEKFRRESEPIAPMIAKLKSILRNAGDSKVIMLTARADFDNKETFLDTFRDLGIDMSRVHVHRAGNLGGSPAQNKAVWIKKYLDTGKYARVRLYDDAMSNIRMFNEIAKEYPDIKFYPYLVTHEGGIKTVRENDPNKVVTELLNTQATDAKWTMSDEDMSKMEFTASNGIVYEIDFLAPFIGPDEIHPEDFVPDMPKDQIEQAVFIEFSQKNAAGAAKQGVAGTGAAAEVFGIVTNTILEFARKRKPSMLYFQAAESNRQKLYAAIVNRLVKSMPGYTVKRIGGKFAVYSNNVSENFTENYGAPFTFKIKRRKLNVPALIKAGAIFITYPHGEQGWETDDERVWSYSLISLYNVHGGGWPKDAKNYLKPQSYKRAEQQINSSAPNLGSDQLVYDGKYNQILWSIKKLGIPDNVAFLDNGQQDVAENFADGKNPGRKGLAKRSGVNTKASVSSLRKTAKNSSGEKQRMAHWLANMKAGKAKKK